MIIERIKFSKEFFVLGAGEWVTMEAQLQENEDPIECIKELKQKMISMYGGNGNGSVAKQYSEFLNKYPEETNTINRAYERIEDEINDCKTVEDLAKFKPTLPTDLMPVYMNKLKALTNKIKV